MESRTIGRVTTGVLEALDTRDREALTARLQLRRYRPGQVVFNDGDRGECMHLVSSGRFIVEATTPAGVVVALRIVHPGEFFGELALVRAGHRRTGRVAALEVSETSTLHLDDFEALRRERPGVDRLLVAALVERVVRTSELVVEMLMPTEDRVWRRLVVLAEAYDGGVINLTQDHLAHASGTARQTVNRILRQAQNDGVIELMRGGIRVLDLAELQRRAAR